MAHMDRFSDGIAVEPAVIDNFTGVSLRNVDRSAGSDGEWIKQGDSVAIGIEFSASSFDISCRIGGIAPGSAKGEVADANAAEVIAGETLIVIVALNSRDHRAVL